MNITNRNASLAAKLTAALGFDVELTVRGSASFTISTDHVQTDLQDKVSEFFGDFAGVTAEHDEECGSFAYVEMQVAA